MTMGDVSVVVDVDVDYLSAGANRQTAAGDWNIDGTVAFGTDTNIALWRPHVSRSSPHVGRKVKELLLISHERTQLQEASASC